MDADTGPGAYLSDDELELMAIAYDRAWHTCCHVFYMDHELAPETVAVMRAQVGKHNIYQQALDIRSQERVNALQDRD